jgi:hypothetical protein
MLTFVRGIAMKYPLRYLPLTAALLLSMSFETVTAVDVDLSTTGFGPVTYFADSVQESILTFQGCPSGSFSFFCDIPVDLTPGVPISVATHTAAWDLGVNDGSFPGPDETVTIETVFSAGGDSVSIFQTGRLRQIGNDQFQFDLGASATETLALGPLGRLQITGSVFAGQARSNFGGGSIFRSTLLLVVPEPNSLILLGLASMGLMSASRRFVR